MMAMNAGQAHSAGPSRHQRLTARGGHPALRLVRRAVLGLVLLVGAFGLAAQDTAAPAPVVVLTAQGAVSPAMSDYIRRNLDTAAERGSPLVVLKLDTPGGLDVSMREIIKAILASPVPVATWVAPQGARAASAGTYMLYASHIAAMAPATNLGAATPVSLTGSGSGDDTQRTPMRSGPAQADNDDAEPADPPAEAPAPTRTAMEAKVINDAVAYIRGLAEMRNRNADWAETAVREGASLSATAAAADGVIDFVAADLGALLEQADGRTVTMENGDLTLATAGLSHEVVTPDWRTAILSVITNPNVALILMLVGVYGIILEFLNPGFLVAGTVGGISLLLGLYSLALLPVNFAGIGLILLGLALIVAEAFAPSFGILGIGGTAALVLGAVILIDTDAPGFAVSVPMIAGVAVAGLVSTLIIARLASRSFKSKVVSGTEGLIGSTATVLQWEQGKGFVWAQGERWQARGPENLAKGEAVHITTIRGLVLHVERDVPAA